MWEIRKDGVAPSIINRRQDREETSSGGALGAAGSSFPPGMNPLSSTSTPLLPSVSQSAGRQPLKLTRAAPKQDDSTNKENVLRGHERPVTFIMWNRDCNLLFTCGKDKVVCVWSFPEGECLGNYVGHQGAVWACSVTADSGWLVTSGADRLVIVWEARASRELARVELKGVVRYVEWAGGGGTATSESERFVTAHNKFASHPPALSVFEFDGTSITEKFVITGLPTAASQVRWGFEDQVLVSSHDNGELCFWRSDTGAEVRRIKAHDEGISKFDFGGSRELLATVSTDKTVRVWDLGKGGEGNESSLLYKAETDRPLNAVAMGPLTREAAVGSASGRPSHVCVIAAGGQDVRDVALSGASSEQFGTLMFGLGSDPVPASLKAGGVTKGHFGPVHTLAFARDGTAIASGSEDGCVRIHMIDPTAPLEPPKEPPSATSSTPAPAAGASEEVPKAEGQKEA